MAKKIILSVLIFLATLEIGLRITGKYYTSGEKSAGTYSSNYRKRFPTWYHHWTPNKTVDYRNAEFRYSNSYNELGHREMPFSLFVQDTVSEKIICIGDSFTEGDGTPYDSTWVKSLEEHCGGSAKKLRFYNAGVCGSDVFFNQKMLMNKLLAMKPACVIECLNTSDITDVIWLGGEERFNADGTASGKTGADWGMLYKHSHLFRAVIHGVLNYDNNLVKRDTREAQRQQAAILIAKRIEKTANELAAQHVAYYLVIHPCPHEIRTPDATITYLEKRLDNQPFVINISDTMRAYYRVNNIESQSHTINGHFNSTGYWAMGGMIFSEWKKTFKTGD